MVRGRPYNRDRGGFRGGPGRGGGPREVARGGQPFAAEEVLGTVLRLMFEKRTAEVFDPSTSMLNLTSMADCSDLVDVKTSINFNSGAFCNALVSAVKAKFGIPRFVNINSNRVRTLHHLAKSLIDEGLADSIGGISAASNDIHEVRDLAMLKKFSNLQELVLAQNPICRIRDYNKQVAKQLPQLLGLDCEAIVRPPLALPNPICPEQQPNPLQLLQMLQANHFDPLSHGQADIVANLYHSDAILTITSDGQFSIAARTFSKNKVVMSDLARFQQQLRESIRRGGNDTRRTFRGRSKVMTELTRALYPRNFIVTYLLCPTASVSLITTTPVPIATVTLHGTLGWAHSEVPNEVQKGYFDRTVVMIFDENARVWQVTNDNIHLRKEGDSVLMFANNPERMKRLSNKTNLPVEVVEAIVSLSSSDLDFMRIASTIQEDVYTECLRLCNGNIAHAVRCCNVAATRQISADAAFTIVRDAHFSIDR